MSADKPQIKIFISSPADVRPERLLAQRVIERLAREYASSLDVQAILWEREPLLASEHFQENIPQPRSCDIVVVILWSRLGILLPTDKYKGPISGGPVTGTEWEFEDALASWQERRLPDLMFYRKQAEVTVGLGDRQQLDDRLQQLDKVEAFIKRWFLAADGTSFTAAIHSFGETADFEDKLQTHLRELLRRHAGAASGREVRDVRWHQAPFRGLLSFEFEHAPVFFGRAQARNDLRALLTRRVAKGPAFALIMGASGSGKSSLIKAGLLPDLTLPGMIGSIALCRFALLRPSDAAGDPIRALALALLAPNALPELADLRHDADTLAGLLRAAPEQADVLIRQGLAEAASRAGLTPRAEARIAIIVDQLEELFTQRSIAQGDREIFTRALKVLACCNSALVLATMRSDFFDRLEDLPALEELSREDGRYLLMPPNEAEIAQMIRQPAREAGLVYETDADGIHLDDVILAASTRDLSALPLLSFLLDQLWLRRSDTGVLTFKAYQELGGLEGALGSRAEDVFNSLAPDVQTALPGVLRMLATVGDGPNQNVTARTAPLAAFPEGSQRRKLIDAFLAPEARLLVAELEGDEARVRIAHEALFTHWPRARESIAEDRADLRLRSRLESAAETWSSAAARDRGSLLLRAGRPLTDALDLLLRRREDLTTPVISFIEASRAMRRRTLRWRGGIAAATAAAIVAVVAAGSYQAGDLLKYRELRRIEASRTDLRGTLIAYATAKGQQALDGEGSNGPYLEALLRHIGDPTLDINTLFLRVNEHVVRVSASRIDQVPEYSSSLNGQIFLTDPPPGRKTYVVVVGASQYKSVVALPNSGNDARAFAKAMRDLKYNVDLVIDPERPDITKAIERIETSVVAQLNALPKPPTPPDNERLTRAIVVEPAGAPPAAPAAAEPRGATDALKNALNNPPGVLPNSLVIVYLAGHGVQINDTIYFGAVDASIDAPVSETFVNVNDLIKRLKRFTAAQVVIADVCRDNPFAEPIATR